MPCADIPPHRIRNDYRWLRARTLTSVPMKCSANFKTIRPVAASSPSPQQRISDYINDAAFPCVGAKSALHKDRMWFEPCGELDNADGMRALCRRLEEFSSAFPAPGVSPVSLVAMYEDRFPDERSFENALWKQLQAMHEHDRTRFDWDANVSSDPAHDDFSLSIAGRAFFVVGLHPQASRLSRRAPFPCLVFNFHGQFASFKETGKYQGMQSVIRKRDLDLQGSVNPVLAQFGESSEARQYSGRAVEAAWKCPFVHRAAAND